MRHPQRMRGDVGVNWISVEERMPEREGYYLVYSCGDYEIAKFRKGKFHIWEQDAFESMDWRPTTLITHWMPLPEPPEGVTGE